MRVEDASRTLLAEDEDSGGGKTAFVHLEAQPGAKFSILVATRTADETGKVQIAAFEVPHIRDEAKPAFEAAKKGINECRELWNDHHPDEARAKIHSAVEDLLALRDARHDSRSPAEIVDTLWTAGYAAFEAQDLQTTRAAFEAACEARERVLPEEHLELQKARQNLAVAREALGDLEGARTLEEKVLAVRTRALPDDHPDLQSIRENLAVTLEALGDAHSARVLLEKVLEIRARTSPDDDPNLQATRANLAAAGRRALGVTRGASSQACLQSSARCRRRAPIAGDSPKLLAATIKALGDWDGARALEEKVLDIFSRTLPDEHLDLQSARQNLAVTIGELGDLQGERALEEKVLEVRTRLLPDDHPDLQAARENLAATLEACPEANWPPLIAGFNFLRFLKKPIALP